MELRSKYNLSYVNDLKRKGDIEKFLKREIEFLLAASVSDLKGVDFDDIYVHNYDAESTLKDYLEVSSCDKILFLTGLTGSGKSMLLKHVFRIFNLKPVLLNNKHTLVIPFTFDNLHSKSDEEIKNFFARMIRAASKKIESTFSVIQFNDAEDDFIQCVEEHRADLLYHNDIYPPPSNAEQINNMIQKDYLGYVSMLLKFYLYQIECEIDNVVFILDDIEGVGEEKEIIPITIFFEIITCMQNISNLRQRTWDLKFIISCRHYVYRITRSREEFGQTFEAYSEQELYELDNNIGIEEIIDKRYNAKLMRILEKDRESWGVALKIIKYFLNLRSDIWQLIVDLELKDLRTSLSTLKKLIFNSRWIQRDSSLSTEGAHKVEALLKDLEERNINSASLIRALGMEESLVYNSEYSIIKNLLYNSLDKDMDIFVLLTLKYFLELTRYQTMDWSTSIEITTFYERMNTLFEDDSYNEIFKIAIRYLITERILLRSIDQFQQNSSTISKKNIDGINKVYVSNAALDMWRLLGESSVLFEMFVDDIWIDNFHRPKPPRQFRGFDRDKFDSCLRYMHIVISAEHQIINAALNIGHKKSYFKYFGNESISRHLLSGLSKSVTAYYRNNEDGEEGEQYQNALDEIDGKIHKYIDIK